jgi:hypothetical protein
MRVLGKRFLGVAFVATVCACKMNAQTVSIDGEFRPRAEYRDGFGSPLSDSNDPGVFTYQRTRLGASFSSAILKTQFTVQDTRSFGKTAPNSETATLGVFEAWSEFLLMPGGSLKVGRQVLAYDDNRLFSASNWSNTGNSHDLALFKYNVDDFQAHLGFAYNNTSAISSEAVYAGAAKYRYMGLLWLSKGLAKGLTLSAIAVDEGMQPTTDATKYGTKVNMNHGYTFGGNLKYSSEACPFSALGTAYFQAGKNQTGDDMSGSMAAIKLNYKLSPVFTTSLGTDYLSGDDNSTDGKQKNFRKLYGANHSFNGSMEYWSTPLTQGLLDYYGSVNAKVSKKSSFEGVFHVFNTSKDMTNKGTNIGKSLGSELDICFNYKLNEWTNLQAGWSTYFANDNTRIAKGMTADTKTRFPQWGYVMLTVSPSYLKSIFTDK